MFMALVLSYGVVDPVCTYDVAVVLKKTPFWLGSMHMCKEMCLCAACLVVTAVIVALLHISYDRTILVFTTVVFASFAQYLLSLHNGTYILGFSFCHSICTKKMLILLKCYKFDTLSFIFKAMLKIFYNRLTIKLKHLPHNIKY